LAPLLPASILDRASGDGVAADAVRPIVDATRKTKNARPKAGHSWKTGRARRPG